MAYLSIKQINHLKDLQKQNYKGKRSYQGISLVTTGLADSVIELAEIMEKISVKDRGKVIDAATPIALQVYKSIVPVSKKEHKVRSNPWKSSKMQGWEKTDGAIGVIQPGNLKRSIIVLSDELKSYKRRVGAIGPLYKRILMSGKVNSMNAANGWYAHMVYGSAKAWRSRIVNKARTLSRDRVLTAMAKEGIHIIQNYQKNWWRVS
jgi:hypothetical protein